MGRFSEKGQTVLEASLIIAVLVLVLVASIPPLRESVIGVFNRYSTQMDESNPNPGENPNPPEPPPLTSLGSTVSEISGGMLDLINDFYSTNNRYPRSWGDFAYTDLGLDPAEWKDKEFGGVIYKPNGSLLRIRPG